MEEFERNINLKKEKVDAQEWLDKNYPDQDQRKEIEMLNILGKGLTGSLNLEDFTNLKSLKLF